MKVEKRTANFSNSNKLNHGVTVPFQVRIPNCRLLSQRISWPESPLSPSNLQSCLCRINGSTFQDIIVWDVGTEGIWKVSPMEGLISWVPFSGFDQCSGLWWSLELGVGRRMIASCNLICLRFRFLNHPSSTCIAITPLLSILCICFHIAKTLSLSEPPRAFPMRILLIVKVNTHQDKCGNCCWLQHLQWQQQGSPLGSQPLSWTTSAGHRDRSQKNSFIWRHSNQMTSSLHSYLHLDTALNTSPPPEIQQLIIMIEVITLISGDFVIL